MGRLVEQMSLGACYTDHVCRIGKSCGFGPPDTVSSDLLRLEDAVLDSEEIP